MIFTSADFVIFFAIVLGAMAIVRSTRGRQAILLVASYVFYGWWNPWFLFLIAGISTWSWVLGEALVRAKTNAMRRVAMWLSVTGCLGALAFFKYANFTVENVNLLVGSSVSIGDILLPVGISFFTFQSLSYNIDLYRGRIEPCRSLWRYLLFVSFFPQLVAGPIVRASEFLPQLEREIRFTAANFWIGAQIFLIGAVQKVLVADSVSPFVDRIYLEPALYSAGTLWLGLFAYGIQIFCDFSGYSLMAIGIARILGFELPENFRLPYISRSIAEFWRRWHITLSFWLRDYLYISLGGNRGGPSKTMRNLKITMLLGGLWHGASWNFVLWGALHGGALAVHRIWRGWIEKQSFPARVPGALRHGTAWALTLLFSLLAWIPFRSPSWATTQLYLERLVFADGGVMWVPPQVVVCLAAVIVWHVVAVFAPQGLRFMPTTRPWAPRPFAAIVGILLLFALFLPQSRSAFIYFQF